MGFPLAALLAAIVGLWSGAALAARDDNSDTKGKDRTPPPPRRDVRSDTPGAPAPRRDTRSDTPGAPARAATRDPIRPAPRPHAATRGPIRPAPRPHAATRDPIRREVPRPGIRLRLRRRPARRTRSSRAACPALRRAGITRACPTFAAGSASASRRRPARRSLRPGRIGEPVRARCPVRGRRSAEAPRSATDRMSPWPPKTPAQVRELASQRFPERMKSGQLDAVVRTPNARQLKLADQYKLAQQGDVARRLALQKNVVPADITQAITPTTSTIFRCITRPLPRLRRPGYVHGSFNSSSGARASSSARCIIRVVALGGLVVELSVQSGLGSAADLVPADLYEPCPIWVYYEPVVWCRCRRPLRHVGRRAAGGRGRRPTTTCNCWRCGLSIRAIRRSGRAHGTGSGSATTALAR